MSSERIVTSATSSVDPLLLVCVESIRTRWNRRTLAYVDAGCRGRLTGAIPGWRETKHSLPTRGEPLGFKPDNYIWNAQRYAVKPFVWWDASKRMGDGVLVWLDADTVATDAIPEAFFAGLLGDADVAYLGRGDMHPETGCVVFRLPQALPLIRWCRDAYVSGEFLRISSGWTDCHVFRAGLKATGARARDLTSHLHDGPWNSRVDAFALSPLGPYVTHLKGTRRKQEALCAT